MAIWNFVKPVFDFLGAILWIILKFLFFLAIGLVVGWLIYGIGAIIMDQLRCAWKAGNQLRGIILGSLSAGIPVAFILLETNLYHAANYYPAYFALFSTHYLHEGFPFVDILIGLIILALSIIGILRNIPKLLEPVDWGDLQTSYVLLIVSFLLTFVFIAIIVASAQGAG